MPPTAMPPPSPRPDHGSTAARPPARPPARALSVEGGWGCAAGGLVLLQLGHEAVARLVRVQAGAGVEVRVRVRVRVEVWLGLGLGLRAGVKGQGQGHRDARRAHRAVLELADGGSEQLVGVGLGVGVGLEVTEGWW